MKLEVLKLEDLGTAEAISRYLLAEGIKGTRNSPEGCPLAQLFSRRLGCPASVGGGGYVWIPLPEEPEGGPCLRLPKSACDFISRLDNGDFPENEISKGLIPIVRLLTIYSEISVEEMLAAGARLIDRVRRSQNAAEKEEEDDPGERGS